MLNAKSKNSGCVYYAVSCSESEGLAYTDKQLRAIDLRDPDTRINTKLITVDLRGPNARINYTSRDGSERPKYTDKLY
jgi:hypothetical protein